MDTAASLRILPKLAFIINMYTVYCLNSIVNKTDNVLTESFLNQSLAINKRLDNSRHEMGKLSLSFLGLHKRPPLAKINVTENSAAAYMLELFQMIHSVDGHDRAGVEPSGGDSEFNITLVPPDGHELSRRSTIMCFSNEAHKLHLLPHERNNILYFDFTDVLPGVFATYAEIKIYKKRTLMHQRSHYLVETFLRKQRTNTKDTILQPVTKLTVSKSYEGWLILTVTDAAKYWTVNRKKNLGIYLQVTDLEKGEYIDPDQSGMVVDDGPKNKRTFMVSYFKNTNADHAWYARSERKPRNISPTEEVAQEHNSSKDFWDINIPRIPSEYTSADKLCRRHEMYVNFTVTGWNSWIIAPQGYEAYYCAGICKFPLTDHLNPTVHAILQTFVHDTEPAKAPRVCCVPTKLSPLSILYKLEENPVVYAEYPNMIVEECGCR
ncbi:hypothetical protein ACJMK2_000250 [Sinanodonta woodiana]|uniref:TGF-beta family profile domain-containing protein n=1 Tax=Sinanodonta woodiana TaxID=1069815 RepID=A0ABD3XQG5_SINWO